MESTAIKFEIALLDSRGKVLFNGSWENVTNPLLKEQAILRELKEKKALIVAAIAKYNAASHINYLEKLGLCRRMSVKFEWQGKIVEKLIALNA